MKKRGTCFVFCAILIAIAVAVSWYFFADDSKNDDWTYDYIKQHNIRTRGDMNPVHWKTLFPNVPQELLPEIETKMDVLAQEAGNDEWEGILSYAGKWLNKYPPVYDPKKKSEYWKKSAEEFCSYLDDRINLFREKNKKEIQLSTESIREFFVHQLSEEQKQRLLRGEPVYTNPYLGVFHDRYAAIIHSWNFPQNPAQAFMFEKRNEELAPFRTETESLPELKRLDLHISNLFGWDGSTSLQTVAKIVAANSNDLPWEWRKAGNYHLADEKHIVFTDYYDHAFDDEVGSFHEEPEPGVVTSGYSRRFQNKEHYYEGHLLPGQYYPQPGQMKPTPFFLNGMKFSQTHQSYVNLIEGKRSLLFATRMPSADETALAKKLNVELEFHPFAKDAFVFIANRHNPVRDLTLDEVQRIFSGKITKWNQVGGFGTIKPLIRDANSGSEELMRSLVMKNVHVKKGFQHQLIASMSGIFDALEKDVEGIGYSIMYYDRFMVCSPYTRTIRINGVEPTPQTVADGSYPLIYQCVAVVRKDSQERAKAVAHWLCSEEGAKVVRESGYCSNTP